MATDSAYRLPRYNWYTDCPFTQGLNLAADLIRNPANYFPSASAVTVHQNGKSVRPWARRALRWSLKAAIDRAAVLLLIKHDEDDFDCERTWNEVRWAGIEAGFGDDVSRWTHFQALGAIELVLETYNFVSNAAALGVLRNRDLKLERAKAVDGERLFTDWALLAKLRTCHYALYDMVGHVVGQLGGQCDDHHDVLRELDRVAKELGYKCSTELHLTAPVSDICAMIDWAWWEATARHHLGYRADAELPN